MKATPARHVYSNPGKLIAIHRWMGEFEKKFHCKPAIEEISLAFGISTSVARFYLGHMTNLKMGWQPKLIREKTGREIAPTRSYILLPLDKADPSIVAFLACELVTDEYKNRQKEK